MPFGPDAEGGPPNIMKWGIALAQSVEKLNERMERVETGPSGGRGSGRGQGWTLLDDRTPRQGWAKGMHALTWEAGQDDGAGDSRDGLGPGASRKSPCAGNGRASSKEHAPGGSENREEEPADSEAAGPASGGKRPRTAARLSVAEASKAILNGIVQKRRTGRRRRHKGAALKNTE